MLLVVSTPTLIAHMPSDTDTHRDTHARSHAYTQTAKLLTVFK